MRTKKWKYGKPTEIKDDRFYIVDLFADITPKLLWNVFQSHEAAVILITERLSCNFNRYIITTGPVAKKHKLKFYPSIRDSSLYRGSPYYIVDINIRYLKKANY